MRKLNLYLKFMFIAIFSAMSVSQAVIAKDETLFQLDGNDYQASDFSSVSYTHLTLPTILLV